jgi:hypothetical protein
MNAMLNVKGIPHPVKDRGKMIKYILEVKI